MKPHDVSGFFAQEVMVPGLKARKDLARLCSVIAAWLDYAEREVFRGGCFFTAVSAEFDSRPGAAGSHGRIRYFVELFEPALRAG